MDNKCPVCGYKFLWWQHSQKLVCPKCESSLEFNPHHNEDWFKKAFLGVTIFGSPILLVRLFGIINNVTDKLLILYICMQAGLLIYLILKQKGIPMNWPRYRLRDDRYDK